MRQLYPLRFVLLVFVVLLSSCSKSIKIVNYPSGEVARNAPLNFSFSEPVAPKDSVGKWSSTNFFEFEPKVKGWYHWTSEKSISFHPKEAYPDVDQITIKPNPALKFGKRVRFQDPGISFKLIQFKPIDLRASWQTTEGNYYRFYPIHLALSFNENIHPNDLREKVKINIGDKEDVYFNLQSYSATSDVEILLEYDQSVKGPIPIQIAIEKGLTVEEGNRELKHDYLLSDTLEPIDKLSLHEPKKEFKNGNNYIQLSANQGLDPKAVKPYISLVPDMEFEILEDGSDIMISADFRPGGLYTLICKEGMPGKAGGVLPSDQKQNIVFPARKPFLKFADEKGHYLMRNGFENLNAKAVNVEAVQVRIHEIYENNLLHFLRVNPGDFRSWSQFDSEDEYYYGHRYGYLSIDGFGSVMMDDTIQLSKEKDQINKVQNIPINLHKQLRSKFTGIYAVSINSIGDHYMDDYKIVSLSDIGIIARWTPDDLLVFVNRLSTTAAAAGTRVNLISTTNQVMRTGVADGNGFIRFSNVGRDGDPQFHPRLITTQSGKDFNFLDLRRNDIDHYRFDLDGKEKRDYEIYCYADRNLYRPGDTLHIGAIVRDWNWNTAKGMPIDINISGPNGKDLYQAKKPTDQQGGLELNFPIPENATTGRYYAEVRYDYDSRDQISFQVEDFVPDKIEVQAKVSKPSALPGDTLRFPISAAYYFGAPCDDHRYRGRFSLDIKDFRSKRYPDFNFKQLSEYMPSNWEAFEGKLDTNGLDTLQFMIPSRIEEAGIARGFCHLSVFDNAGHPVHTRKTFTVATRPNFIGFRTHGSYFNIHDNFQVDYLPVSFADLPVKGLKMELEVIRYEWNNTLRVNEYGKKFVSEKEAIVVRRDTITSKAGISTFRMRIEKAGNYTFALRFLDGSGAKKIHFSAYGKSIATSTSFGVRKEGTVEIQFDKSSYQVGDQARVLFTAPFSGKMLVTLEREGVYDFRYVNVQNGAAEIHVPIQDAFLPNFYVTATLFRPQRNKRQLPMTVAHGFASAKVESRSRRIPIKVIAPERTKPGKTQRITIQTHARANTNVTVAVVDEGILAIKHFRTPDAYPEMYAARELDVESLDMYGYLLPEVQAGAAATGGSDGSNWTSYPHLNPVRSKRYRPFAWWSGIRKTNSAGKVTLDVPIQNEFNGLARIMVLAYDGNRFGAAEERMVVREDVVVMPAIPRFLTIGDTLSIPVSVMNLTESAGKIKLKIKTEGPIAVDGPTIQDAEIDPMETSVLRFKLGAKQIGNAKITLTTEGIKQVSQTIELPIRPASELKTLSGTGALMAGQQISIEIPNAFTKNYDQTDLTVSRFQGLQFADELNYLLGYPHGCLEQTTSKAFPQLYFGDLAELIAPGEYKTSNAMHHLREAIHKIEGMQMYDGSFSYWQGGGYGNEWASTYATHFLVEARKAGFPVQKEVMEKAIRRVSKYAESKVTTRYTHWVNGSRITEEKANKTAIYALYVLALSGDVDVSLLNYFKSKPNSMTEDSKYLLAAAYALQKDQKSFDEVLPKGWSPEMPIRQTGGSFDSPARATAIMLNALVEADPSHPRIPQLVQYLNRNRDKIYSTQDKAWMFMGIGKAIRRGTEGKLNLVASMDGKNIIDVSGGSGAYSNSNLGGKKITLKAEGEGTYYYHWKHAGYEEKAGVKTKNTDNSLKVRRAWFNTEGERMRAPTFHQGDLVVCRMTIEAKKAIENIAIIDMIPAGFEVENQRLSDQDYSWIKDMDRNLDQLDIRDDRVNTYVSFDKAGKKQFNYLVRATNTGMFLQPAILAEAMYAPTIQSHHSGDTIRILPPNPIRKARNQATAFASANECEEAPQPKGTIWEKFLKSISTQQP